MEGSFLSAECLSHIQKRGFIMRKIRIALMGCGRISASYARLPFPAFRISAEFVCAIDIEEEGKGALPPFRRRLGVPVLRIFQTKILISSIYACLTISMLLPPYGLGSRHACPYGKTGSITLQDADRMKAVSERTGKKNWV